MSPAKIARALTNWSRRDRGVLPHDFYQASYTEEEVRKYLVDRNVDPDGPQFVAFTEEIRPNVFYKDAVPGIPNPPERKPRRIVYNNVTPLEVLIWIGVTALIFQYIFSIFTRNVFGS